MAVPNSPAEDIATYLNSQGVGTLGGSSGWSIFIGTDPTDPETVITCYDIGGLDPNPKFLLDWPQVQIRVRGARSGYSAAYTKIQAIKDLLIGRGTVTVGGTDYIGFWMLSDILFVTYSEDRPIFSMNMQLAREPSDTTQREAI